MKRSPLIILAVTLFIDLLGFGLILPLLPVYITHFGGKPWVGGALLATFSTMQFIFSPIWGRASDRYGRRPLILLSLCGSAVSFIAFGFAPNLLVLFIARIGAGILSAASIPTAQAYIADVTPPEKRSSGMAVLGAAFGLGFAIGPVIGGFLSRYSVFHQPALSTPALFAAVLCLFNFIWAFLKLPESLPEKDRQTREGGGGILDVFPAIANALRNPDISAQLTVFSFTTFAFAAVESSFSWLVLVRFTDKLTQSAIGTWQAHHVGQAFSSLSLPLQHELVEKAQTAATSSIFGIVGITMVVVQGAMIGGLSRRIGENRLVMFGTALLTLALLGISFAPSLLLLQAMAACIALGSGVLNPSLNALITHAAGPRDRGSLSGTQQGLGSLARIIAPPINNTIVAWRVAPFPVGSLPFLSSCGLMSVAFLLSLRLKPLADSTPLVAEGTPDSRRDEAKAAEAVTPAQDLMH